MFHRNTNQYPDRMQAAAVVEIRVSMLELLMSIKFAGGCTTATLRECGKQQSRAVPDATARW
jgi:hypothetical protein